MILSKLSILIASTTLSEPVLSFLFPRAINVASLASNAHQTWHLTRHYSSSSSDDKLKYIAESLKTGLIHRVMIVVGAGVSCAAGIPDFRTPGSGLYDNLHKFNLPYVSRIEKSFVAMHLMHLILTLLTSSLKQFLISTFMSKIPCHS